MATTLDNIITINQNRNKDKMLDELMTYVNNRTFEFNRYEEVYFGPIINYFYMFYKVTELKEMCKMNGLKGYSNLRKKELVQLLLSI